MEWKRAGGCANGSCVEWARASVCAAGNCLEVGRCESNGCVEVGWSKSSASSDSFNCVEVSRRTASASGGNGCVQVECGCQHDRVYIRDSKFEARGEESPIIEFSVAEWRETLKRINAGVLPLFVEDRVGSFHWFGTSPELHSVELKFTKEEWLAFLEGAKAGEFEVTV